MEFRKAKKEDLRALTSLEKRVFTSPWTYEQFNYELDGNEFSDTIVIYDQDILIGYINYWIIFDQATVNKVCIDEKYRKQGLALKLFEIMNQEIENKGCIVTTLEVRVSNTPAINLYKKLGFSVVTKKKQYYSDGEDAYYMVKGVM